MCNEDGYNVAAALLQPKISDEAGNNPRAQDAPDKNVHKIS